MGASTLDMKREVLERVMGLYHKDHSIWNTAADDLLEPEEKEKWGEITELLHENPKVDVAMGEGNLFFGRLADEYGSEVLDKAEQTEAVAVAALDR
jgi:hypothetical protein